MVTKKMYGKTLPFTFSAGYLYAFERMMGKSVTMAYYQGAAHIIFPDKEEREKWLTPLHLYFRPGFQDRRSLDYIYISLFEQGIRNNFLPNEQGVIHVTKQVGKRWWHGLPPVYPIQDDISLKFLLSPTILNYLDETKKLSKTVKLPKTSSADLVQLGLFKFVEIFNTRSKILCSTSRKDTSIEVGLGDCPFCLNQSNYCRVFLGIIEGLLEWLHGTHQPNAIAPILQINEEASTGHSILLDIL